MTVFRTAWEAACATPHVARADETPTVQVATVLVPSASSSAGGLALVPPPSWRQGLGVWRLRQRCHLEQRRGIPTLAVGTTAQNR